MTETERTTQLHLTTDNRQDRAEAGTTQYPKPSQEQIEASTKLRGLLEDPDFRSNGGCPTGSTDAIMAMSGPPDYTACPNPFIEDWVREHGRPHDPSEPYEREPFAVDVSVGKTDALYRAHGYHTKVPHLAIVPSILHYTEPGDIVLDGFCGSGMTGVAAQWCDTAPATYRHELEAEWKAQGRDAPAWGARRAILNDLSPAATFIAANYNRPFDIDAFATEARRILDEVDAELGWMYETRHSDGSKGRIEYTVWSEVFACPNCGTDITFVSEALDDKTKRVREDFPCPRCSANLSKGNLERLFETSPDPATGEIWRRVKFRPVFLRYRVGSAVHEKKLDQLDLDRLGQIAALDFPSNVPTRRFPIEEMYHGSRIAPKGFLHIHHFFMPRAAHAIAALWTRANVCEDDRTRQMLLFFVEQAIWGMSILNRYQPIQQGRPGGSQVNRQLNGVYYVASQVAEVSPQYNLGLRLERLVKAFKSFRVGVSTSFITTGDCAELPIPEQAVDYIFTDPPFGENIYYADLNYLVESWHGVLTNPEHEAIVDQAKRKALPDYGRLMQRCFAEYYRVLKPGRWMTVVFSNSKNAVWNVIQEGMLAAGFVVADVRTMDKQQGSYRQVTSTAVKQDLVISAYKPAEEFEERFNAEVGTVESAWSFVRQHLANLPVVVERSGVVERIAERQPNILFDRMVAFHIQRNITVPISSPAFLAGVQGRFAERDGMLLLANQVQEYDEARLRISQVAQLPLMVFDEKSSILWLRQQLDPALGGQPMTYQEIQPRFLTDLRQLRHEELPELRDMLALNFLEDGQGRWFVPDPGKAEDLERLRRRELLQVYAGYHKSKGKLRAFRSEAIRVGFAEAYRKGDFEQIVKMAERIPEERLQEDPDMLMYYDNASLRFS
jgi:hypothetical protein